MRRQLAVLALVMMGVALGWQPTLAAPLMAVQATVGEGNDYFTRVLRDPIDMSNQSDVWQYLNQSGQANIMDNIGYANGVFSARQAGGSPSEIHPLFPGYLTASLLGRSGDRYPINSATYRCLYVAMRTQSSAFFTYWWEDESLNLGTFGNAGTTAVQNQWVLYRVDLATAGGTPTAWNARSTWRGLRITPTTQAGDSFSVDWVRLTNCGTVNATITFAPNSNNWSAVWLRSPDDTTRYIRVATGLNGNSGSVTFNTEGIAADTYEVYMGNNTTVQSSKLGDLTVDGAPVAVFNAPSPWSGADWATSTAGNAWDFSVSNDVADAPCISNATYGGGLMSFQTLTGVSQPGGCRGGLEADPRVVLNMGGQSIASPLNYRYLSYRMYTDPSLIQNVPDGMIVRWIWTAVGQNGVGTCTYLSQDLPFDVGWQTYWIDLTDSFDGSVELAFASPGATCLPAGGLWGSSNTVVVNEFHPNENQLGFTLAQQLDWVRLTRLDQVAEGTPYEIDMDVSEPSGGVTASYYYTTTVSNPTQNVATMYSAPSAPPAGPFRVYLPLLAKDFYANRAVFIWDTTGVAAGTYFICARLSDGANTNITSCSEAPVQVTP